MILCNRLKPPQLKIADRFEQNADRPQNDASSMQWRPAGFREGNSGMLRERDGPHHGALQPEDNIYARKGRNLSSSS